MAPQGISKFIFNRVTIKILYEVKTVNKDPSLHRSPHSTEIPSVSPGANQVYSGIQDGGCNTHEGAQ